MKQQWDELERWEQCFFEGNQSELVMLYDVWQENWLSKLNDKRKRQFLVLVESGIVHLHSALLHNRSFEDVVQRIITQARIFKPTLSTAEEMKQLSLEQTNYLAEQAMAKQRLLSLGQGGVTGLGGFVLLAADLPALMAIQLRSLQQLAFIYGYDPRHPMEQMLMLKLLHVATVPKHYQRAEWDKLIEDCQLHQQAIFYEGDDAIFHEGWLQQLTTQLAKGFLIAFMRKKTVQSVPLLGIVIGAGSNYLFTKQVIEVAKHFYTKRRLLE
ncbi:EcsC family protein [Bacillus sp. JCM 19034]|uniref:EcsC family protein n=1 Tax=Bacillus sp. JCM 19034 TaxID=1481928 RepID=UPI0007808B8F|nr:EcsC family protein [Bacillus sp. JCM 19034]